MRERLKKIFSSGAFFWIPGCAAAYLWIFLAGTAADALSPLNLDVFAPGILVVVPALLMPLQRGFAVALVSGLLFDASLPIPYETMEAALGASAEYVSLFGETAVNVPSTTGFGMMWTAIFFFVLRFFRRFVAEDSPREWLFCALAVNFVIFLLWACGIGWSRLGTAEFWLSFAADALTASAFIVLLGWWYFDAVVSLYRICGADLLGEEREAEA